MTLPDELAELEKTLSPQVKVLFSFMRQQYEEQRKQSEAQRTQNERLLATNNDLLAQLAELRQMLFGRKSEKMPSIQSEVRRAVEEEELFRESEENDASVVPLTDEEKKHRRRKQARKKSESARKKARKLRKNLPVIEEQIFVTADQLPEGYSLEDFRQVCDGKTIHRLEHVKEHLVVVEYILQRMASKDGEHIVSAKTPIAVADKGHYGSSVYAHAIVSKCADSLSLYRIERGFERAGLRVSRSTLCSLFHRAAELTHPLWNRMIEIARQQMYLNADETGMPIWQEGGCAKGWIWTMVNAESIVYAFSASRGGEVAKTLLGDTKGYLQVDGYSAYNAVCGDSGRTRVACWAHARRMFFKALKSATISQEMLDLIRDLYVVEYRAAERQIIGSKKHRTHRRRFSRPILAKIKTWMVEQKPLHPPKSPIGKAIRYSQKQWDALTQFVDEPELKLDNNVSERALRILALGRKNYLFVGHSEGGENLAILQSLVATCLLHQKNPYDYFRDILLRVQTHPQSRLDELLPQNWQPAPD